LEAFYFCEEIEQFVHEVALPWWSHGVSEESLRTFLFFAQCNTPARLEVLKVRVWGKIIRNWCCGFQRTEELNKYYDDNEMPLVYDSLEKGNVYFDSITTRLSNYEHLQDAFIVLELAFWKVIMTESFNGNIIINEDTKVSCHRDEGSSILENIIFNVLSFLLDE
jgi:hypothetical protein